MLTYKLPHLYEFVFKLPPALIWRKKSINAVIKILSYVQNNKRRVKIILDVGCGCGILIPVLKKLYKRATIIGIDSSYEMISFAKNKYKKDAQFIAIDFFDFIGNYDLIILFYSLQFMELEPAIDKIIKLLNKDGICIIVATKKALFSFIHKFFVEVFLRTKMFLYYPWELKFIAKKLFPTLKIMIRNIDEIEGSFIVLLKK